MSADGTIAAGAMHHRRLRVVIIRDRTTITRRRRRTTNGSGLEQKAQRVTNQSRAAFAFWCNEGRLAEP